MDYATRNKRFLAQACKANGMTAEGSPAQLMATLSARCVTAKRTKIENKLEDTEPLNKTLYVKEEIKRMMSEDQLAYSAKLEAEAEERWEMIKKQRLDGSEIHIPSDVEKDAIDSLQAEGYKSVIIEPDA
eukprot:4472037-Prymnesium_polylepis.1